MRQYVEEVQVRERGGAEPTAFVWRERFYVVHEVLAHWHERSSWWEEGPRDERDAPPPVEPEVWRVAASAGRRAPQGTFELGRGGADGLGWRMLQVVD